MAVLRFEVVEIVSPFKEGECLVKAKLVSVHAAFFSDFFSFRSSMELKVGEEFQENNKNKRVN